MATGKLTSQDLDRITKFLIYKSLQIIVQSRLGEKVKTSSKAVSSGLDWFNVSIKDIPEVLAEAKRAFTGPQFRPGQHVCAEISLKTSEGDTMVLETWSIGMTDQCDTSSRGWTAVYNRMGIALKSLFSVSRVTPAYKLSRRQGADNYVICYRIYCGEPQYYRLGEGYQMKRVGAVPNHLGTIKITIAYRTKLLISPQKTCKDIVFDLKDDHFKRDNSPKRDAMAKPCKLGYKRESIPDRLDTIDAADTFSAVFSTSPPDHMVNKSPIPRRDQPKSQPIQIDSKKRLSFDSRPDEFRSQSAADSGDSFQSLHKVGAFAQHRTPKDVKYELDEVPFMTLLQEHIISQDLPASPADSSNKLSNGKKSITSDKTDNSDNSSGGSCSGSTKSMVSVSVPDDFVMVELKAPFASTDMNTDLNKFYRECQGAPPLSTFENEDDVSETLNQITDQLVMFESNITDFDMFVSSLDQDSDS